MPDGPTHDSNRVPFVADASAPAIANEDNHVVVVAQRPAIPHITDRFIPISHIVTALARTAYADLRKLRQNIVDFSDQKRKKKIVDYAAKYRAEVVKVLVLVNWAARADEVSTAIDLRAWLQGQKNCFDNLYGLLRHDVLRNLESAKVMGPDIPTAIDVLTTASLPQLHNSDITRRFQVPKPLSAADILKTLRTVNALLSLRLLLHETLPSAMQRYSVGSGRVTFHVNNEFSVDLFFATEDVDSTNLQWFMIDFRFDFTSGDHIETPLSLKLEIEGIANSILARTLADGRGTHQLVELYNFLHSFTIQYKLERLFSQFSIIGSREKGRIDVKYASAQKVLAVGFWLSKRHRERKSVLNSLTVTIEEEDMSAKDHFLSTTRVVNEYNRERLKVVVRLGEEEQPLGSINIEEHSASSLLLAIVQNRIDSLLKEVYQHLISSDLAYTKTSVQFRDSCLCINLVRNEYLQFSVDEFNGDYFISFMYQDAIEEFHRPHKSVEQLQAIINTLQSPGDIAVKIHDFRSNYIKREIEAVAASAAWDSPKFTTASIHLDDFGTAFGLDKRLVSPTTCLFFTRLQEGWKNTEGGSSWFVVLDVRADTLEFWIAEFVVNELQGKWQVQWVEKLRLGNEHEHVTLDTRLDIVFFERLWRLCTARIISLQISRALGDRSIDHRYVRNDCTRSAWTWIDIPHIVFAAEEINRSKRLWTKPIIKIVLSKLCTEQFGGTTVAFECEKLDGRGFDLSQCGDVEVNAVSNSTQFSFNFKAVVAQNMNGLVDQFCRKWRMVENTVGMIEAAGKLSEPYLLKSVSLNVVTFEYGEKSYLVQIQQQPSLLDDSVQFVVNFGSLTPKRNPHLRISHFLSPLATRFQNDMRIFFEILSLTFPVVSTLHHIEQDNYIEPSFYIMARSIGTYRIYYPKMSVALLIRVRPAPKAELLPEPYKKIANTMVWHFTDASRSSTAVHGQLSLDSCEKIFNAGLNKKLQTDMTFPEGSGIGCTPELAGEVLLEVHRTILEHQQPAAQRRPTSSDSAKSVKADRQKSGAGQRRNNQVEPPAAPPQQQTPASRNSKNSKGASTKTQANPKLSREGNGNSEVIEIT